MDYFKNTANNESTVIETTVHSIGIVAEQKCCNAYTSLALITA